MRIHISFKFLLIWELYFLYLDNNSYYGDDVKFYINMFNLKNILSHIMITKKYIL